MLRLIVSEGEVSHRLAAFLIFLATATWMINFPSLAAEGFLKIAQMAFALSAIWAVALIAYPIPSVKSLRSLLLYVKWGYWFILFYAGCQLAFGPEAVAVKNVTALYEASFDEILNKHNIIRGMGAENTAKTFSTYQNGNLFSISIVMFLPIAAHAHRSVLAKVAVFFLGGVFCILSGSASGMIGYAILLLLAAACAAGSSRISKSGGTVIMVFLMLSALYLVLYGIPEKLLALVEYRVLDRDFSDNGRWVKTAIWWNDAMNNPLKLVVGDLAADVLVYEILPLSIAQFFGFFVLFLFYGTVWTSLKPLNLTFFKTGALAYLVMSIGEGGYWLTPIAYLFGLNLAICAAIARFSQQESCSNSPSRSVFKQG
ncbi:hypothetical protein K3552_17030 [Leisingera aquaemixtae]|uniref:hypothetical protein n=1 Tax=Leisingera aquaemixtae TaxID=1396826 RepID=UPI0021A913CD|nr:hypothetical protein [Leisingera aquaemixtae]UWQ37151.1 hypothetical protein K3552_17030 [Leisingera aquaemixtae]